MRGKHDGATAQPASAHPVGPRLVVVHRRPLRRHVPAARHRDRAGGRLGHAAPSGALRRRWRKFMHYFVRIWIGARVARVRVCRWGERVASAAARGAARRRQLRRARAAPAGAPPSFTRADARQLGGEFAGDLRDAAKRRSVSHRGRRVRLRHPARAASLSAPLRKPRHLPRADSHLLHLLAHARGRRRIDRVAIAARHRSRADRPEQSLGHQRIPAAGRRDGDAAGRRAAGAVRVRHSRAARVHARRRARGRGDVRLDPGSVSCAAPWLLRDRECERE